MGLDGFEIVMAWEESFGIGITDAEAGAIRTPRMAIDLICRKLDAGLGSGEVCLSQRAFHRLRSALVQVFECPRVSVTPRARLDDLIPFQGRRGKRQALSAAIGVPFPTPLFGFGVCSATVGGLTQTLVARHSRAFQKSDDRWTRPRVRQVVRAVISDQLGIPKFSDDADFVTDLRCD